MPNEKAWALYSDGRFQAYQFSIERLRVDTRWQEIPIGNGWVAFVVNLPTKTSVLIWFIKDES